MTDPKLPSAEESCCAHIAVRYEPDEYHDGMEDRWVCDVPECEVEFVPKSRLNAVLEAAITRLDDHADWLKSEIRKGDDSLIVVLGAHKFATQEVRNLKDNLK